MAVMKEYGVYRPNRDRLGRASHLDRAPHHGGRGRAIDAPPTHDDAIRARANHHGRPGTSARHRQCLAQARRLRAEHHRLLVEHRTRLAGAHTQLEAGKHIAV